MVGQFVNSTAPGNFGSPGIYVYNAPNQQVTPTGPALGKLGCLGTAQWGPKNQSVLSTTNAALYANWGASTLLANSLVRDALAAMPEANQVVGVRVTDGTDTAAAISIVDGAAAVIGTLTAIYTGSLPNGVNASGVVANPAQASLVLATGSLAAGGTGAPPTVRLSISFPGQPVESFTVVAGTASAGLVMATLKANLATAVNTGTASIAPSQRWTFTAGASAATSITNLGTAFNATGGTDGASTITSTILIGTDGITGRTGLYALRGAINGGQYILAGCYDTTLVPTLVPFNNSEGVRAGISFPLGTSTATAVTLKATNSVSDPTIDVFIDWVYLKDPYTGLMVYTAPHAKGMGIISSLDYFQSPLNKPSGAGAQGVTATERFTGGINQVSGGEYTQRYANGINYLTQLTGNAWVLASDKTSDGKTLVSDARAAWFFGVAFMQVFAPFLGAPQTNANNDPTRTKAKAAVNAFMAQQFTPVQKIGALASGAPAYSVVIDTSNNTPTTVAQGFLLANIAIQTVGNAAIILVQDQIGVTVNLTTTAS